MCVKRRLPCTKISPLIECSVYLHWRLERSSKWQARMKPVLRSSFHAYKSLKPYKRGIRTHCEIYFKSIFKYKSQNTNSVRVTKSWTDPLPGVKIYEALSSSARKVRERKRIVTSDCIRLFKDGDRFRTNLWIFLKILSTNTTTKTGIPNREIFDTWNTAAVIRLIRTTRIVKS